MKAIESHCFNFLFFFSVWFIYLFFYFTILYWFCHTLTWIRHGYTCVPHPEPPSHPCKLSQSTALGPLCCRAASHWLSIYTREHIYVKATLSIWGFFIFIQSFICLFAIGLTITVWLQQTREKSEGYRDNQQLSLACLPNWLFMSKLKAPTWIIWN